MIVSGSVSSLMLPSITIPFYDFVGNSLSPTALGDNTKNRLIVVSVGGISASLSTVTLDSINMNLVSTSSNGSYQARIFSLFIPKNYGGARLFTVTNGGSGQCVGVYALYSLNNPISPYSVLNTSNYTGTVGVINGAISIGIGSRSQGGAFPLSFSSGITSRSGVGSLVSSTAYFQGGDQLQTANNTSLTVAFNSGPVNNMVVATFY